MTIDLHMDSTKCLYEQIYEYMKHEIKEGKLLAGERLPSTRSLAEYLQIARNTVNVAYDQLLSEGYIEARPYKGYYVSPLEELLPMEKLPAPETVPSPEGKWVTQEGEATAKQNAEEYDCSLHEIDMSGFPFATWKRITKKVVNDGNSELFSQGDPRGDYDLRLTISRYLHASRGVNSVPEQIIVGAGNDYLLMLLEKILGRRVRLVMENPTYKKAYRIFRSFSYEIETIHMDENGMKVAELFQKDATAVYVMPSHQFPTGTVMPIGRRRELLKWASLGEERYVIEDDYDSEFRYRGKPIPSLQASDTQGKVIYIGTFSKAIAPAIRVSYMVLPFSLLQRYNEGCYYYSCTVSRIDQRILNEFIKEGYFERHLHKMRKIYRAKHDLLLEQLRPLEQQFILSGEDAGLHLVLTAKESIEERELVHRAALQGVRVYGLSENMLEPQKKPATVLLGFGGLKYEDIPKAVEGLKKAWLT